MSEYAPEYTRKERIIFLVKHMLWFLPLYAGTELWFFDWLSDYSDNAHCYRYGELTGVHLVMYGIFVGIPLSCAFFLFAFEGPRAIQIIRVGQNPLPGEKVFKKTKYKFGAKAKTQPVGMFVVIGFFVVMSLWGAVQAYEFTQDIEPCQQQLINRTSAIF